MASKTRPLPRLINKVKIDHEVYGVYRAKTLKYRVFFLNHNQGILMDDLDVLMKNNRVKNGLYQWQSVQAIDTVWERVDG